jgi:uncharacterized protein
VNEPEEAISVRESAEGVTFAVHVQPRASKCGVTGVLNGAIKIRLTSPPVDGAANDHCIRLFADLLKVRRQDVTIVTGETSRNKVIKILGINGQRLQELLAEKLP